MTLESGGSAVTVSIKERTIIGSVSYWNRYWVYCIESATVESADITCITAGSAAVNGSTLHRMIKEQSRPVTRRVRMTLIDHNMKGC